MRIKRFISREVNSPTVHLRIGRKHLYQMLIHHQHFLVVYEKPQLRMAYKDMKDIPEMRSNRLSHRLKNNPSVPASPSSLMSKITYISSDISYNVPWQQCDENEEKQNQVVCARSTEKKEMSDATDDSAKGQKESVESNHWPYSYLLIKPFPFSPIPPAPPFQSVHRS